MRAVSKTPAVTVIRTSVSLALLAAVTAVGGAAARTDAPTVVYGLESEGAPLLRAAVGSASEDAIAGTRGVERLYPSSTPGSVLATRGGELLRVPLRRGTSATRIAGLPGVPRTFGVLLPSRDGTIAATSAGCAESGDAARAFGVYRVAPQQRRLVSAPSLPKTQVVDVEPKEFSPDNEHLAYTTQAGGECRGPALGGVTLHVLNLRRRTAQDLDTGVEGNVAFSPDGRLIAYAVTGGEDAEIRVATIGTRRMKTLARSAGVGGSAVPCCSIAWARRIVIYAMGDTVYARPVDGGRQRVLGRILETTTSFSAPRALIAGVSPDGGSIAYAAAEAPRFVYVARVSGGAVDRSPLPRVTRGTRDGSKLRVSFG
jgi:hypothetical protein